MCKKKKEKKRSLRHLSHEAHQDEKHPPFSWSVHLPQVHASDHLQPLHIEINDSSFMMKPPKKWASLVWKTELTLIPDVQNKKRSYIMVTSSLEASSPSLSPYLGQSFAVTEHHRPFHISAQWLGSLYKAFSCWRTLGICVHHLQPFKTSTSSYTFPSLWYDGAETSLFQLPMITFAVVDTASPAGELQMPKASTTWTGPFMAMLFSCGSGLCSHLQLIFVIWKLWQLQWPSSSAPLPVPCQPLLPLWALNQTFC